MVDCAVKWLRMVDVIDPGDDDDGDDDDDDDDDCCRRHYYGCPYYLSLSVTW